MKPAVIGVLPAYAEEALQRFRRLGFEPDDVTELEEQTRFHFSVPGSQAFALASAIPTEFYYARAIVGDAPVEKKN